MKKTELEKIRKVAIEAAIEAGKITLRYYRKRLDMLPYLDHVTIEVNHDWGEKIH